ncbi:Reverse transcriptase (RNA-dependent DNA polymerase), putative [Entamoeba histolytica]
MNCESFKISSNQLGCKLQSLAAKEGIINSYMMKQQKEEKYPKYVESYYDIKKAYDTVNHEWVIESLKYFNYEFVIIDIIENMMTRLKIFIGYKFNEYLGCIKLNRGILQGDSLSNLLFIIQMNVISQIIEEKFPKANHTLYMDDLRIMTESSEEMGIIHNEIKEIISGIGMEMNEKKSGMVLKNIKEIPNGMQNIPLIEGEDLYKYLGI